MSFRLIRKESAMILRCLIEYSVSGNMINAPNFVIVFGSEGDRRLWTVGDRLKFFLVLSYQGSV